MTKLSELLAVKGYTVADIKEIYSGKDSACRCGCKGKYFKIADPKAFKRALTRMTNVLEHDIIRPIRWDEGDAPEWVNVPNGDPRKDHCYCIYFTE